MLLASCLFGCGGDAKKGNDKAKYRPASEVESADKDKSSGYTPKEAKVARIGKVELAGAHESLDAVGKAVVAALNAKDAKALQQQLVTKDEFYALFGALSNDPQRRGASVQLAWMNQSANSRGSLSKALSEWGGKELVFVKLEPAGTRDRPGLIEHRNPKLVVKNAAGEEQTVVALGPVLEQKSSGKFKLLSFRDRE